MAAPAGQDIATALLSGEIDAAIGMRDVDALEIQPLIPEPRHAAMAYFQQTGIYPSATCSCSKTLYSRLIRGLPKNSDACVSTLRILTSRTCATAPR